MSDEGFDAGAAAAAATGDVDADDPVEDLDPERVNDQDDDVVDLGSGVAGVATTLVAADERGPTAPTLEERLDLDEGTAHIVDAVTDIVLDVVDADVGDTVGPLGKLALGISRLGSGGGGGGGAGGQASAGDAGGGDDGLSSEAREIVGEVDGAS